MTRRSILITGCSSGIGHHAAVFLAARGWQVFATCRKQADCDRLTAEGLESFRLDYEDPATITEAVKETLDRTGGRLDALFNNGAYAIPGAVEDMPTDAFRAIFEANFFGWHELTRQVLPAMRAQGSGRIVQNSSVLGFCALRMRAPYVSTKFAIEGYTDTLRLELAGTNIHPILLEPGPVRSQIRVNAQPHYERWVKKTGTAWEAFYRTDLEPRLYATDPAPDWGELGCEATSAKLVHALESRRPRIRYRVTTPTYALWAAKRLLPARWLDAILVRV